MNIKEFKELHHNCFVTIVHDDNHKEQQVTFICYTHKESVESSLPNPMYMCRHPYKCLGLGSCPRDISCNN